MSIQGSVSELQNLKTELKALNKKRGEILKKIREVEGKISLFLKEKEQPGVKYQGNAIILEKKEKPGKKKNKDRDLDAISVLKDCGIKDAEFIFKKIMEARKGPLETKEVIKVAKIK